VQFIRYAALLHDIGHGPFSHVSERALERYADRSKLAPHQKKEKIHEIVTAAMIRTNPEIVTILGKDDCEHIVRLLGSNYAEPVEHSVVSGPLDADKQDYLLRDSYFCGVQYGVFDLHQLHRSLKAFGQEHDRYLMLEPDGVHAAEQFVLAKYYLTTNVYRHKVRLITDEMIVRAIVLGIDRDEIEELRTLFSFDNSDRFVENYAAWDDNRFIQKFGGKVGTKCGVLLERLRKRLLLKRVFQAKPKEFSPKTRDISLNLHKMAFKELRAAIESGIAEKIQEQSGQTLDADFVILNTFDIKSVREMSRNDEASILVAKTPEPVSFEEESSLFASINEGFKEEFIEVYAPIVWETRGQRERLISEIRGPIFEIVEEYCTGKEEVNG
ncbi:MAG: uncharacterized protein QG656_2153, partial [Candidatus Hydrogenedentes bacterium]|nr:uncharacterized protein [Candidatus Hydrogenedentota bacterium]